MNKDLRIRNSTVDFLTFAAQNEGNSIEVRFEDDTLWLTQQLMADLFQSSRTNIVEHIRNIYRDQELTESATCRNFRQVRLEGNREVSRELPYYNLDMIIAVGYRVNSKRATEFRQWATAVLRNYAIRGYQVDALDYVLKPVSYFAFSQKLDRAISRIKKEKSDSISIEMSSGMKKLRIDSIFYIESEGHNLIFYTDGEEFQVRAKMSDFEEKLTPYHFFRSNKGYLVNLKYVDGVEDGACLIGGKALVISRARKSAFMDALTNYMAEM